MVEENRSDKCFQEISTSSIQLIHIQNIASKHYVSGRVVGTMHVSFIMSGTDSEHVFQN